MIKAIVFDIDGVLVNSEEFYFQRRMNFFKDMEITPASTNIRDFIGSNVKEIWETLVPDNKKLRELLKKKYLNEYEKSNKIDFQMYARKNLIYLFKALRNNDIRIALASAGSKSTIQRFIEECKISTFIEFIESGEECKNNKPNPEIYLNCIRKFNILEEEIIVVEDSTLGIKAAKDANLQVIAFRPSNYYINQEQADYYVDNLMDIMTYI